MQSLQQTCYTYFIGNDIVQFRNSHTLLLHGITITQCYAIVLQSLVVYGDTMQQERVAISELNNIIADKVSITSLLKTLQ